MSGGGAIQFGNIVFRQSRAAVLAKAGFIRKAQMVTSTSRDTVPVQQYTNPINIIEIVSSFETQTNLWTGFEYNGPCILKIIKCKFIATGLDAPLYGELLYAPFIEPKSQTLAGLRAKRGFCVYLATPGKWKLKWQLNSLIVPTPLASKITVAVYDASDPLVAAEYLSLPGAPAIRDWPLATPTALTTLIPSNFNRTGIVIRNGDGSAAPANARTIVYNFSQAVLTATLETSPGFILRPGQTDVLAGDVLNFGPLQIMASGPGGVIPAAGTADIIWATEFFL